MRRLAVVLFLMAVPLAALEVPYLSGRVVDNADLVPDDVQQRIEQRLAAYEQQTTNQIAVLTVESLEDEALEDRSEERRVGKECRAGGWPEEEEIKRKEEWRGEKTQRE